MKLGVFTTIKILNGIPLFFEEHINRLSSHIKAFSIPFPVDCEQQVMQFIQNNHLTKSALRVVVNPNGTIELVDWQLPKQSSVSLITVSDNRDENKIYKTTDRHENEKAVMIAKKQNADDAVFVKDNNLIEATRANIFSINNNEEIITPPMKEYGLQGIVRAILIKKLGIKEEHIPQDTTAPIVLTNCLRIQKATHLNGRKLKNADELFETIKTVITKVEKEYLGVRGVTAVEGFPIARTPQSAGARREGTAGRTPSNKHKKIFYKHLSTWIEPDEIFEKLFSDKPSVFWLDSNLHNDTTQFSYMGSPEQTISYSLKTNTITINNENEKQTRHQDIFTYLDEELKKQIISNNSLPFPFIGGFVGYFGYELKKLTGSKKSFPSPYPDSLWLYTTKTIVFDHKYKKVYVVCLAKDKTEADDWFKKIEKEYLKNQGEATVEGTADRTPSDKKIKCKLERSHQQYVRDIKQCQEYLAKGESYQICLTNQFSAKAAVDPLTLYQKLRQTNPAPYAAFIKHNDLAILSCSPEEFLRIDDRFIETKPIKGTIRRGEYEEEDKALMKQLADSKKEWSENAMIVDLLRNDLGKVCQFGTVRTKNLMRIETYQTVHQLVSTITGTLTQEASLIDCVRATFPGGSMTGAPKIRTMEIIDQFEKKARGIYSGCIGFLSLNQNALLSIAIRTIVIQRNELSIGAGGAILIDSNPQKEYEEMMLKANILLQTVSSLYNPAMNTVYLALGSNMGNKKAFIKKALTLLEKQIKNITVANLYETNPMYFENQDTFINTALKGETSLSPQEVLIFIKAIEKELGRKKRFRNGPREIDIDILFYDNIIFKNEHLQIPHPLIQERDFVLKPLMDIAPELIHPVFKKNIKELIKQVN